MSDVVAVCLDGGTKENWRECADVLYSRRPRPLGEALLLAASALAHYPGCVLAVVATSEGGHAACLRGEVTPTAAVGPPVDAGRSH
ncbi:hypothetical protein SAMN06272735_6511 [Streptomyces sp. TLI_55]|uniref:hypothetical protein n=1 Tax=Streptomyces sp. TLI_55 TaxID=1938861 RepID=UPI000BD1B335|nr:hypothetical protein [Streptomyces sp. TLI_55]SNX64683.1 hypothetical protein SAMN06272735_6511 [Streptomyces sp. TLI_55]